MNNKDEFKDDMKDDPKKRELENKIRMAKMDHNTCLRNQLTLIKKIKDEKDKKNEIEYNLNSWMYEKPRELCNLDETNRNIMTYEKTSKINYDKLIHSKNEMDKLLEKYEKLYSEKYIF
jgi:hypothetical protein